VFSRPGSPYVADASQSQSRTQSSHDLLRRLSADGRLESTADEASSDAGADGSDPMRAHLLARHHQQQQKQQRTQQKPSRAKTAPNTSTLVTKLDRGAGVGVSGSGPSAVTSSTDWSSSEEDGTASTTTSTHDEAAAPTSRRKQEQPRSYRVSNMSSAHSFDEPRSGQEERRRAVLGDDAVDRNPLPLLACMRACVRACACVGSDACACACDWGR
jgi:hypothetical protein